MDTVTASYKVPEGNMLELRAKLEKLGRKAARLGLPPITMAEVGTDEVPYIVRGDSRRKASPADMAAAKPGELVYFRFVTVQVTGTTPRLAGWEFVATLQHLTDGEGVAMNMLRTVPGFNGQLPEKYRTASPENCDHCQKAIKTRKETFIVRSEDGTWKQVGRNCTQDFLGGKDPQKVAAALEMWLSVGDTVDSFGEGMGGGEYRFGIEEFLAVTAAMVRVDGWLSRSRARMLNGEG